MQKQSPHSKRFGSRLPTHGNVYVCWGSVGDDDSSRVRDLSSGGLFVQTQKFKSVGAKTNLHFLVEEGQIRAEAVMRQVEPSSGLGLEFTAVREEDRPRLADLLQRLREFGSIARLQTGKGNQQAPAQ